MANRLTSLNDTNTPWHLAGQLWILRLLVHGQAWKVLEDSLFEEEYADTISLNVCGLNEFVQHMHSLCEKFEEEAHLHKNELPDDFGSQVEIMRKHKFAGVEHFGLVPEPLRNGLAECEALVRTETLFDSPLKENLAMIAHLFGLTQDEKMIFAFLLLVKRSASMRTIVNLFNYKENGLKLMGEVISCATGIELTKVRKALQPESVLMTTLVKIEDSSQRDMEDIYGFNSVIDAGTLLETAMSEKDFFESRFSSAQKAGLELEDFDHIPRVKDMLLPYLKKALDQHRAGVNILLYGDPGTGKTELSRVLGQELNARTYEIATKESHSLSNSASRLDHWQVACRLLKGNERALLLLDEAEDVFFCRYLVFRSQHGSAVAQE